MTDPSAGISVVPLALLCPSRPVRSTVNGTAVALARAGNELFDVVDTTALDGPPLCVHEGEVEMCRVAMGGT